MRLPIAADGWFFVAPSAILSLVFFAAGWGAAGWLFLALAVFCLYFFRDPERTPPEGEDLVVAPADGKVVFIDTAFQSPEHPEGAVSVSIFLSIFNVHVQRCPLAGEVTGKRYNRGRFMAAWSHKASLDNEQVATILKTGPGVVLVKQIAGLVARRIVSWVSVGDRLDRGQRLGLIRFGSRVDLVLPAGVEIVCSLGDRVKGGETVMARAPARREEDE
ncbi:MAG: phosphatidylserine decarboxylase family protein [Candidatus Nitrospinota bacterium M3_3B_026]